MAGMATVVPVFVSKNFFYKCILRAATHERYTVRFKVQTRNTCLLSNREWLNMLSTASHASLVVKTTRLAAIC